MLVEISRNHASSSRSISATRAIVKTTGMPAILGCLKDRSIFLAPVPRQQLIEAGRWMTGDAGAHFAHPAIKAGDKGCAFLLADTAAAVGSLPKDRALDLEQRVDAANGLRPDSIELRCR